MQDLTEYDSFTKTSGLFYIPETKLSDTCCRTKI